MHVCMQIQAFNIVYTETETRTTGSFQEHHADAGCNCTKAA